MGRVTELARIVYDRHGESNGTGVKERRIAIKIALDALYGLSTLTQASDSKIVVSEALSVMQSILLSLTPSATSISGSSVVVEDPNQVQAFALRRILLLLVSSLSNRQIAYVGNRNDDDSDDEEKKEGLSDLEACVDLTTLGFSSALWVVGEWMTVNHLYGVSSWTNGSHDISGARQELLRLIDNCFPDFKPGEKGQAIHFASKIWMSHVCSNKGSMFPSEIALCEHILAMGRMDVNHDVKDRSRFESSILHSCNGLKYDTTAIEGQSSCTLDVTKGKAILLTKKPNPSYLPIEDDTSLDTNSFRFGTLSSLVGHRARGAYIALPQWAQKNSPVTLREPIEAVKERLAHNFSDPSQVQSSTDTGRFYANDSDSDSSTEDSEDSDDTSTSSSESDSSASDSDSDSDSSSSSSDNSSLDSSTISATQTGPVNLLSTVSSSSSNDSNSESGEPTPNKSQKDDLLGMLSSPSEFLSGSVEYQKSTVYDDLKNLVLEPMSLELGIEKESSPWLQIVRPSLCGGLSVKARYLRGATKEKELLTRQIDPSQTNIVCVQLQFANS